MSATTVLGSVHPMADVLARLYTPGEIAALECVMATTNLFSGATRATLVSAQAI